MGTISRHAGAPFASGETLDGTADLEVDIAAIVSEVNGNLDNSNIVAGADISGAKLADATVPGAKLEGDAVTTAKMVAAAVTKASVETSTSADSLTTSALFTDVPGLSSITVTPGSTSDQIVITFSCWLTVTGAGQYAFAFSVGGTDTDNVAYVYLTASGSQMVHAQWSVTATAASSTEIKVRHKRVSGSSTAVFGDALAKRVFRVEVFPQK